MKNSIITIVVIMIMTSCKTKDKPSENPVEPTTVQALNNLQLTEEQVRNAGVETGPISTGDMQTTLQLKGITALPPQGIVSIHVPLGGYLKSTTLRQGMYVKKGELLAVVEDAQYVQLQQDYLNNLSQLKLAEAEYNRQKTLFETQSASEKVLQQAEITYKNLGVAVKSLEERLRLSGIDPASLNSESISGKIRITSSINGYVIKVNANTGKYIQPKEELFELADLSAMYLVLDAFESDIPYIQPGTLLTAYTNQQPEKKFKAKVTLVEKYVSEDRSVKIYADFTEPVRQIIPGTYMNASLVITTTGSMLLPEEALVTINNKQFVFVKEKPGSFILKEVQTGQSANGMVSVISDQTLIDKEIVLKGAYWLQMQLENQHAGEE